MGTVVGQGGARGPTALTAWGMLDYTNSPYPSYGPDHVYWNPNVTNKDVPHGCYRLCAESLEGFFPPLSSSNFVTYDVDVTVHNSFQKHFTGIIEAEEAEYSTRCIPTGRTLPNEFNHGYYIGDFGYPNIQLDYDSDPQNCGGCNLKCPEATDICRSGSCVSPGDLRISLISWNRTGDLDLIVFPPVDGTAVDWEDPGPRAATAWGKLEQDGTIKGPENIFWNSTRVIDSAMHATPHGEYRIVSLTFQLFINEP